MNDMADEQLAAMFTESGEMRYFDELVRRHAGKVRAMIYPMVFNDADADDLTQEVFLRIVNNIRLFRKESLFSTWLYRIVMNTTRSHLRRKVRTPVDFREEVPEWSDSMPSPDRILMAGETGEQVERAMAELSPILRAAITLTAIHGMSVGEAAKVEGCLAATMYWRVHEARRLLRKKLERNQWP